MNVVAYLRVSTALQASDGLGLEIQEQGIAAWCEAHGHRLVATHRDEGVSGDAEELDRPGLAAALAAVDGGAEGLVVYRLDRLARRLFRQELVIHQLRQRGRTVLSVCEADIDDDDPTKVLMRQMLGAFAEFERAVIRSRLQGGRRAKAARGGFAAYGSPAFGSASRDRELVAEPAEQETIARIVELRSAGASLREISRTLAAEGRPAKRGGAWHPKTLARVLARLDQPELARLDRAA
ncbi:MAG: recombinase family protein [Acidimicrobiia bacterium]